MEMSRTFFERGERRNFCEIPAMTGLLSREGKGQSVIPGELRPRGINELKEAGSLPDDA